MGAPLTRQVYPRTMVIGVVGHNPRKSGAVAHSPRTDGLSLADTHVADNVRGRIPELRAGEAVKGLTGPAFGGFGAAGAQPGAGQVRARLGETLFEVADFRLKPVLRRHGVFRGRLLSRHRPFGIRNDLPALGGTLF